MIVIAISIVTVTEPRTIIVKLPSVIASSKFYISTNIFNIAIKVLIIIRWTVYSSWSLECQCIFSSVVVNIYNRIAFRFDSYILIIPA